ncbi:ubiquitin-related domain-containing protein [Chlamydoabsidia padenii]|nr:ubiquitin-related domain-containing protein [Chlamydoabsidia padenii]
MATINNEHDFIDNYLKEISTRSVRYGQDYLARTLPSPLLIKRKPNRKQTEATPQTTSSEKPTTTVDSFELVIKTLKPSSQFNITRLTLEDTILNLKQRIYQQRTIPVKQQRLLLKGKVLNDEKTLGDYNLTKDTTLHLMISKPATSPAVVDRELSSDAQATVKGDSFWKAIEQTLDGQLGAGDATLVLDTWKKALSG